MLFTILFFKKIWLMQGLQKNGSVWQGHKWSSTVNLICVGQAELLYAGASLSNLAEAQHPSPNSDGFPNTS